MLNNLELKKNGFSHVLRVFKRAVDIAIYRCKHGKVTLNVICFYIVIHSFCHVWLQFNFDAQLTNEKIEKNYI